MDFGVQEGPGTSSLTMLRDGMYFSVCVEKQARLLFGYLQRSPSAKELMFLNYGVGEYS